MKYKVSRARRDSHESGGDGGAQHGDEVGGKEFLKVQVVAISKAGS
jgi:hypothetical protein